MYKIERFNFHRLKRFACEFWISITKSFENKELSKTEEGASLIWLTVGIYHLRLRQDA